jgi:hypothetical protein
MALTRRPLLWFAGASLLAMVALGFAATAIVRREARRSRAWPAWESPSRP